MEEAGAATTVYAGLRSGFTEGKWQAYAYLLFVLIYMPCVAAFAAMTKEIGVGYTLLSTVYLTVLAWAVATLFYQFTLGHSLLWIAVAIVLLVLMALAFAAIGRRSRGVEGVSLRLPAESTGSG